VDDYVPYIYDTEKAFARSNGPELWVHIFEKAWAKIHGNYEVIEAGHCGDTFKDLTGAPYEEYEFSDHSVDHFKKILEADQKDYMIMIGVGRNDQT
jgi:calpain-12